MADTTYTEEKALSICALICSRDEETNEFHSLRDVSKSLGIPERTIYQWLSDNPHFSQMYTRAREDRAHLLADEVIRIADTEDDPAKAKVRIDARKWWAGRVNPKQYGDKVMGDPNNPVVVENKDSQALAEIRSRIDRLASRLAEEAGGRVDQP